MNKNNSKSELGLYWKYLSVLLLLIVLFNLIFKIKLLSFINLFSLLIPNYFFVIIFTNYHLRKIKVNIFNYLTDNFPEKLKALNINSLEALLKPKQGEGLYLLFNDPDLMNDNNFINYKNQSDKLYFFMISISALSIMFFLISTVFILKFI
jgi:hypothetical protein